MTVFFLQPERLPLSIQSILRLAGDAACQTGSSVYVVGGLVRDLMLQVPENQLNDVDLVAEGHVEDFAKQLCSMLHGKLCGPTPFLTYKIDYQDDTGQTRPLDVVTARREYYHSPACLPDVASAGIQEDLARRDFTINAMAMPLGGENALIDPFNGRADLEARKIHILHDASFRDDPTRMFRAVRFECRLHFKMGQQEKRLLTEALPYMRDVSGPRICHELKLAAKDATFPAVIIRLNELGILAAVHPLLHISPEKVSQLTLLSELCREYSDLLDTAYSAYLILLAGIAGHLTLVQQHDLCRRLQLDSKSATVLAECSKLISMNRDLRRIMTSPRPGGQLSRLLASFSTESLVWLSSVMPLSERHIMRQYLRIWRSMPPLLTGKDLQMAGIPPGPLLGILLQRLRTAQIDGVVESGEAALQFVKEQFKKSLSDKKNTAQDSTP